MIEQLEQEIEASNLYIEKLKSQVDSDNMKIISKEERLRNLLDDYLNRLNNKAQEPMTTTGVDIASRQDSLKKEQMFIPDLLPVQGEYIISQRFNEKHQGLDFAASLGTEVVAAAAGIISQTYIDKYFGNVIQIDHLNTYSTKYAHLAKILVKKGDMVGKGNIIGLVGDTGNSSAPHLHFEILLNQININPENILKIN